MKKAPKIILISLVVVVLLVVAAVGAVVLSLGPIVKTGVEQGGSHALKVPVKLDGASVSVFRGRASLTGFSVANPPGYGNGPALAFGEVTAEVKPLSVFGDVVDVPEVVVRKPAVAIEGTLTGDTNLGQLLKNLDATLGGSGGGDSKPADKPAEKSAKKPAEPGATKRLKLDHLLLEDPQLTVAAQLLGQTKEKTLSMGRVEISGLAKEFPNGMTPAELAKRVLDELVHRALQDQGEVGQVLRKLYDQGLVGTARGVYDDATKLGKEMINDPNKAKEIIKDPKKATDSFQDVKEVKDLFDKDKKKDKKDKK